MIIILGPPGSGKGTQTIELAKNMQCKSFQAGDTLKTYLKTQPKLLKKIQEGYILDSDKINKYLLVSGLKLGEDVIFDGFPRTVKQCIFLCKFIDLKILKHIFVLEVSKEEVEKRIAQRFFCEKCYKTYNQCILCCDTLNIKRYDDLVSAAIQNRWSGFTTNIQNVLDIFIKYNIQISYINGEDNIQEITKNIITIIKKGE
jgi:adenylate kinase